MPTAKKAARKTVKPPVKAVEPEEELHQSQEVAVPEPVWTPIADGWYWASLADGERVLVSVAGNGTHFTLHREAGSCRDIPAEYVVTGYFLDWKQVNL